MPFQQRRNHCLGFPCRRGCHEQCIPPRQNHRDRLLLNRRKAAVPGEENGPGAGEDGFDPYGIVHLR